MTLIVFMDPMESPSDLTSASALNSQKLNPAKDVILNLALLGISFFDPPADLSITPELDYH